jgi:pyrroloquinoline quinone (PQQ) biosynthesis protein C
VAQNPSAVRSWMAIARRLGVSEEELKNIDESKPSVQEKCFHSLRTWQSVAGEQATIHMLTDRLRKCRYRQLASTF